MSDKKVYEVLKAFAGATTVSDYKAAKALCAKSFGPVGQLFFVDCAREAKARVTQLSAAQKAVA